MRDFDYMERRPWRSQEVQGCGEAFADTCEWTSRLALLESEGAVGRVLREQLECLRTDLALGTKEWTQEIGPRVKWMEWKVKWMRGDFTIESEFADDVWSWSWSHKGRVLAPFGILRRGRMVVGRYDDVFVCLREVWS